MRILFLFAPPIDPKRGGVERVTDVLADFFEKNGHKVFFLSRYSVDDGLFDDNRQFFVPDRRAFNIPENKKFFQDFLKKNKIDVVINQFAINFDSFSLVKVAKCMGVKVISVIHNAPLASVLNFTSSKFDLFKKYKITWLINFFKSRCGEAILKFIYKQRYAGLYKRVLTCSDCLFILSDKYKPQVDFFVGKRKIGNIIAMPNPIPFEKVEVDLSKKEKQVLFVSRMLYAQKRPDFILYIWEKVYKYHKDWKLIVLGDGPYFSHFKNLAQKLKLRNIEIKGFVDPLDYYERASILCMTSTYEGFPMTLNECMQRAVVPMAFNSFAALTDIIDNNVNGCIIKPFDLDEYAAKLSSLISNETVLRRFALNAVKKSESFELKEIGQKWITIMEGLIKSCQEG